MRHRIINTCTGPFALMENDRGEITTMWVTPSIRKTLKASRLEPTLHADLARRLRAYFNGDARVRFDDVETPAGSEFFQRCWDACRRIPRGQTRSYAELAAMAGSGSSAARAAGQAMRNNPLPIIVPCHRVVASSGRLHGFAGSCAPDSPELSIKNTLLELEGAAVGKSRSAHRQRVLAIH